MIKRFLLSPLLAGTFAVAVLLSCLTTGCNAPQAEASAAYIGAEVATTALISKNPSLAPVASAIVTDWNAFQGGKLTGAQEAGLLQQIVTATKGQVTPTEAALLDGAVQQILANQNATAPTPLQGAAGAIIQTVVNGISRAVILAQAPAASALYNRPPANPNGLYAAEVYHR